MPLSIRLRNQIENDALHNTTPDLPALRYKGPQSVFIWDDARLWSFLDNKLQLVSGKDYVSSHFSARTFDKFLPVRDTLKTASDKMKHFLPPPNADWRKYFKESDAAPFAAAKMLPVSGRMYSFSLNAMQKMDRYYANGMGTKRMKLKVRTSFSESDNRNVQYAWMWIMNMNHYVKWDPHKDKYSFGISQRMIPEKITWVGGNQYYGE